MGMASLADRIPVSQVFEECCLRVLRVFSVFFFLFHFFFTVLLSSPLEPNQWACHLEMLGVFFGYDN